MEDLVASVDRHIRVEVRGTSTFKIYYEALDPEIAARVANAVAELFINENVNARKAEAKSTTLFLEQQLNLTKEALEEQEARITEFNRSHMAELPAQRDVNFALLEGHRGRLKTNIDEISKQQDRKLALEKELAEIPSSGISNVQTAATDLDLKRARLVELRSQYTEQHPEVTLLKRQIAQLEEQLSRTEGESDPAAAPAPPSMAMSVRERQLRNQIAEIDLNIKDLLRESSRVRVLIGDYEGRVANAPKNEADLLTLKRDYDIMQQSYLELLRNKTQATIAESLEQERQGESFMVLDRAVPPARPYKPNVNQILSFGCAFGLMLGVGIAFLFDILRPKFRSEDELVAAYGIPVLVSIPALSAVGPHGAIDPAHRHVVNAGGPGSFQFGTALRGLLKGWRG
jgi:protein tyrosine kinase modulator